jgi:hypothetical protein
MEWKEEVRRRFTSAADTEVESCFGGLIARANTPEELFRISLAELRNCLTIIEGDLTYAQRGTESVSGQGTANLAITLAAAAVCLREATANLPVIPHPSR